MLILRGLIEGIREIMSHKFRSVLTVLGIVLGVASLMAMFALTAGITFGFRKTLYSFGGLERVSIIESPVPVEQEAMAELSPGRTYADVLALRRSAPLIRHVSPEQRAPGNITLARDTRTASARLIGVEKEYIIVERMRVAKGRFLSDLDQEKSHAVIVLGSELAGSLWRGSKDDPLGGYVLVNGVRFRVVGVLAPSEFRHRNRVALIPLRTMMEVFNSSRLVNNVDQGPDRKLSEINVQVADVARFDEAIEQMRNVLLLTHRGIRDFGFNTREDWFDSVETTIFSARLCGGVIAGVSLLVGGVGIANIMLASIKERIREIGIRRAVGARAFDLFVQILIEAVLLALLGGVLGVLVGFGFIALIKAVAPSENTPIIESGAVLISFASAVAVGIAAGFLPAIRAARLNPISALKYD
jgi:putative ABC transport system permease protein